MSDNGLSLSDSQDTIELDPRSMEYIPHNADTSGLLSLDNVVLSTGDSGRASNRDRPYACHVCNKRFIQKAHLIIHKRIHTGEKPYSCHICNKRFAQSSHLAVHKRVHTGEKPFFCNFCGMGFCRRPRLEAHVLQHVVKEGKHFSGGFKGDSLSNLSMVALSNSGSFNIDNTNQESLDAAAQLMELKVKGGLIPEIKSEPLDEDQVMGTVIVEVNGIHSSGDNDSVRKRRKPKFVRRLGGKNTEDIASEESTDDTDVENSKSTNDKEISDYANTNTILGFPSEDFDKFTSSLTELSDFQRNVLNQSLMLNSSKTHLNNFINTITSNSRMHSTPSAMNSSLTMSGLVRTNNRISLVDFTADDIMKHLMTRDDVKSCDFCCIVFHDPAMYYLHRSMHDKMDVRCCNLCGKLLTDKYDFTAHFLSKHN